MPTALDCQLSSSVIRSTRTHGHRGAEQRTSTYDIYLMDISQYAVTGEAIDASSAYQIADFFRRYSCLRHGLCSCSRLLSCRASTLRPSDGRSPASDRAELCAVCLLAGILAIWGLHWPSARLSGSTGRHCVSHLILRRWLKVSSGDAVPSSAPRRGLLRIFRLGFVTCVCPARRTSP